MSGQNKNDSPRSKAADRTRRLILEQNKYMCKTMPRLVEKNGSCNIESRTIEHTGRKYIQNIFMVLLDTQWRVIMPLFVVLVILSWLVFATVYFLISKVNGDFDDGAKYGNWKFCVENSPDFISMLLFSMETQTTIGYGYRYVNDECSFSVLFVMIQSIWGALLQALLTGLVIAKVQKPKKRMNTLLFSKNACIYQKEDAKYLTIRVGDLQKSNLIDLQARAICVKDKITAEGEYISHFRYDMDVKADKIVQRVTLGWPVLLYHRISPESPFWDMSKEDLQESNFEIIVFLEGTIESTGLILEARSSYLPNEILWGRKFQKMHAIWRENGMYEFDFRQFNATEAMAMKTPPHMKRISEISRNSRKVSASSSFIEGVNDTLDSVSSHSDGDCPLLNSVKSSHRRFYPSPT